MQEYWLRRGGTAAEALHARSLTIFVLGWAADWRVLGGLPADGDVVALYDFREIGEWRVPSGYTYIYMYAWSFGVLAAEKIFTQGHKFTRAVALNGTPKPVDERFGIAPRRMAATLRGLAAGGMEAFERRAYAEHYDRLRGVLSPRGLDANIQELNALCALDATPHIAWDAAVVGTRDEIFTAENQLAYWGALAQEVDAPHYPFGE